MNKPTSNPKKNQIWRLFDIILVQITDYQVSMDIQFGSQIDGLFSNNLC